MSSMKVKTTALGKVSKPLLIHVNKIIFTSKNKSDCILYYRIPFSSSYQSIQKLTDSDLFLPDAQLCFKIINYVDKTEEIVDNNSDI